jgi:hypothetical protein
LPAGYEIYKRAASLELPPGRISEFWFSVKPIAPGDPGLDDLPGKARSTGASEIDFVRARAAVTTEWSPLTYLLRVRLLIPVYAFIGQCSGQLFDQNPVNSNVAFIGGGWQVVIPNLTGQAVQRI